MKKNKSIANTIYPKPQKLKVIWTKMSETLLDSAYGVSAEEQLIQLSSNDERVKKAIEEAHKAWEEQERIRQMKEYAEVYFE